MRKNFSEWSRRERVYIFLQNFGSREVRKLNRTSGGCGCKAEEADPDISSGLISTNRFI